MSAPTPLTIYVDGGPPPHWIGSAIEPRDDIWIIECPPLLRLGQLHGVAKEVGERPNAARHLLLVAADKLADLARRHRDIAQVKDRVSGTDATFSDDPVLGLSTAPGHCMPPYRRRDTHAAPPTNCDDSQSITSPSR